MWTTSICLSIVLPLHAAAAAPGADSRWFVDDQALWFKVASHETIFVGRKTGTPGIGSGDSCGQPVFQLSDGFTVGEVIKGDPGVGLAGDRGEPREDSSPESGEVAAETIFFLQPGSWCDYSMPATPDNVRLVREETTRQNGMLKTFNDKLSSAVIPFAGTVASDLPDASSSDEELHQFGKRLAELNWKAIPALVSLIDADLDIGLASVSVSFVDDNGESGHGLYAANSRSGLIAELCDVFMGMGFPPNFRGDSDGSVDFLRSMWKIVLSVWMDEGMSGTEFLRPAMLMAPPQT